MQMYIVGVDVVVGNGGVVALVWSVVFCVIGIVGGSGAVLSRLQPRNATRKFKTRTGKSQNADAKTQQPRGGVHRTQLRNAPESHAQHARPKAAAPAPPKRIQNISETHTAPARLAQTGTTK